MPLVLVQTKTDLKDVEGAIETNTVEDMATKLRLPLLRVCAKDNTMVKEVFMHLA